MAVRNSSDETGFVAHPRRIKINFQFHQKDFKAKLVKPVALPIPTTATQAGENNITKIFCMSTVWKKKNAKRTMAA